MWVLKMALLAGLATGGTGVAPDEDVVFYPTYARWDETAGAWEATVRGVVYEPEVGSTKRALLLSSLRRTTGVEKDSPQGQLFDRRMRRFLVDNQSDKLISVRLGDAEHRMLPSQDNGHFRGAFSLTAAAARQATGSDDPAGGWVPYRAIMPRDDARRPTGRFQLVPPDGLSVISDIDDTIKITEVGDRDRMLARTFLMPYQAVPGMAEQYRWLAAEGAVFHFVSGSPWQLYLPLQSFMRASRFPAGSFHLKHFRIKDSSLWEMFKSQQEYKLGAIGQILEAFPRRSFLLVGDSGEQDPEVYGALARKYPRQVAGIYIRNVSDESAEDPRFGQAFRQVDRGRWVLFATAGEVRIVDRREQDNGAG